VADAAATATAAAVSKMSAACTWNRFFHSPVFDWVWVGDWPPPSSHPAAIPPCHATSFDPSILPSWLTLPGQEHYLLLFLQVNSFGF